MWRWRSGDDDGSAASDPIPNSKTNIPFFGTLHRGKSAAAGKSSHSDRFMSKGPTLPHASDSLTKSGGSVTSDQKLFPPTYGSLNPLPRSLAITQLGKEPREISDNKPVKLSLSSDSKSSRRRGLKGPKPLSAPSPYESYGLVSQQSPQPVSQYPGNPSAASASPSPDMPSGPFAGATSDDMIKGFGSLLANKTGMMPAPEPVFSREAYSTPLPPRTFYTVCSKGKHPFALGISKLLLMLYLLALR